MSEVNVSFPLDPERVGELHDAADKLHGELPEDVLHISYNPESGEADANINWATASFHVDCVNLLRKFGYGSSQLVSAEVNA